MSSLRTISGEEHTVEYNEDEAQVAEKVDSQEQRFTIVLFLLLDLAEV